MDLLSSKTVLEDRPDTRITEAVAQEADDLSDLRNRHDRRTSSSQEFRSSDGTLRGSQVFNIMPGIREFVLDGGDDKTAVPVDGEGHGLIPTYTEFEIHPLSPNLEPPGNDTLVNGACDCQNDRGESPTHSYSLFPSLNSIDLPRQQLLATELRQSEMSSQKWSQRTSSLKQNPPPVDMPTRQIHEMPVQSRVNSSAMAGPPPFRPPPPPPGDAGASRGQRRPLTPKTFADQRAWLSSPKNDSTQTVNRILHNIIDQPVSPADIQALLGSNPNLPLPNLSHWSTESKETSSGSGGSTKARKGSKSEKTRKEARGSESGGVNWFANALKLFNSTPLVKASKDNDVEELLHRLAPSLRSDTRGTVDVSGYDGWTALHWAARLGHDEIAEILLKHNAKTEIVIRDPCKRTALIIAAQYKHEGVVKHLLEFGAAVNARCKHDGSTALHWASSQGNTTMMDILISHGANTSQQDIEGMSPTWWALMKNQLEAARVLIAARANLETRCHHGVFLELSSLEGQTVLQKAVGAGRHRFARMFLEAGADPDAEGPYGLRPIHRAAMKGDTAMVALLLEYRAVVDPKSKIGWTPLHFAARHGYPRTCVMLIRYGAVLLEETPQGHTPKQLAKKFGYDIL